MKESENSRFLEDGKMISDEDLRFVNQLVEKAQMAAFLETDSEVVRFLKWIIERLDDRVTMHKGGNIYKVIIFIWYDEVDGHVKVRSIDEFGKIIEFVVDKKGHFEGNAIVNEALKKIRILKNFNLSNNGHEGEYKGWPCRLREIIMRL